MNPHAKNATAAVSAILPGIAIADGSGAAPLNIDPAQTLLRHAQASYLADLEGSVFYANDKYKALATQIMGDDYDPAQAVQDLSDVIANIISGEEEVLERALKLGEKIREVHSARHFPIHNDAGEIVAVGGFYRESTRRVQEWEELKKSRDRYDDISRLSSDLIWETNGDFLITYVSSRVTEIIGYHPREIIGQNLFALGAATTGQDKFAPQMRSPFRDVIVEVTDRTSRIHQIKMAGLPIFDEQGGFCGYRGTATDISAEAEARESAILSRDRLTTAIENISEGFALYDGHNRLVLCNNRLREYLGGANRVLFPGAPLPGILQTLAEQNLIVAPGDALDSWLDLRSRAIREGEASIEIRLSNDHWLRVTDRPTEDGGIVSIVSDITEAKEREETLLTARDLAEQGSRSKSEFLANMSHELRTPLNAIIGFSQVMRAETLGPIGSPRYIEYLDDIIDSSEHLLGVINDILDVAKSEAGKIDLNEETVDINEEIRLTARLFAEQASASKVKLSIEVSDNLPALNADQRKIRQILLNLVSNAVKFTPPDGSVTVSASINGGGGMDIVVNDTGIGIEASDIAAALAPFGQVESNLSRRYEGTGLGLPLTQALIERHGGELVLDSEPGRGTRVTARFPGERVIRQLPAEIKRLRPA